MKIVSLLKPFLFKQQIVVYDNGNKIEALNISLEDFNKSILELSNKYNIIDVELIGSKKYAEGIKNNLQKEEILKYKENKLNIIIK